MERRPIEFRGSALGDLRTFPQAARREAGFQLDRLQCGLNPENWMPMSGAGVRKICVVNAAGAFRVIYVAKFATTVYALHCLQKRRSAPAYRTSIWLRGDSENW